MLLCDLSMVSSRQCQSSEPTCRHAHTVQLQWRNKLIDQETFRSWTRDLEYYAQTQHLGTHWPRLNDYFESSFAQHVRAILVRQAKERQ
jgi:hypothetical protein